MVRDTDCTVQSYYFGHRRPYCDASRRKKTDIELLHSLRHELVGQSMMSSSMAQSSWLPSGKYRRILIGIFLSLNSFMAIFKGSVSFSMSTITGAFMLEKVGGENVFKHDEDWPTNDGL